MLDAAQFGHNATLDKCRYNSRLSIHIGNTFFLCFVMRLISVRIEDKIEFYCGWIKAAVKWLNQQRASHCFPSADKRELTVETLMTMMAKTTATGILLWNGQSEDAGSIGKYEQKRWRSASGVCLSRLRNFRICFVKRKTNRIFFPFVYSLFLGTLFT